MSTTSAQFEIIERPFADLDSDTRCGGCGAVLDGKQVVHVPAEQPDEVYCDLDCARRAQTAAEGDDAELFADARPVRFSVPVESGRIQASWTEVGFVAVLMDGEWHETDWVYPTFAAARDAARDFAAQELSA